MHAPHFGFRLQEDGKEGATILIRLLNLIYETGRRDASQPRTGSLRPFRDMGSGL